MIKNLKTGLKVRSEQEFCTKGSFKEDYLSGGDLSLPVYNEKYILHKDYILGKIANFNKRLSKNYNFKNVEGPEIYSLKEPMMNYYTKKFPASLYEVHSENKLTHVMRPACCPHALGIWSKYKNLPDCEIIHEVANCYRLEKSGECRSMRRANTFIMPDYHMLISDKISFYQVFKDLRFKLLEFLKDIGLPKSKLIEIYRTPAGEFPKNFDLNGFETKDFWVDEEIIADENARPYFILKYQVSYLGAHSPVQLMTIQLDNTLTGLYGLSNHSVIHFSMGSIMRLLGAMALEKKLPALGVLVKDLCQHYEDIQETARPLRLVFDLRGKGGFGISKTLSGTEKEIEQYPWVILRGFKEKEKGTVKIIDRLAHKEQEINLKEIATYFKNMNLVSNNKSKFHLKGPLF